MCLRLRDSASGTPAPQHAAEHKTKVFFDLSGEKGRRGTGMYIRPTENRGKYPCKSHELGIVKQKILSANYYLPTKLQKLICELFLCP